MLDLREYFDLGGQNRYRAWFDELDVPAATKVTTALERLALGNKSSIEPVGAGVSEYKIDFGPGYRIYFGKDGDQLVILLAGGTKKRQSRDIADAKTAWLEYKQRKHEALMNARQASSMTSSTRKKEKRK